MNPRGFCTAGESMSDKEKKQNGQAGGVNSQKPEKKMTKYDLKMQRRREEELRQQKRSRYSTIAGVVIPVSYTHL